MTAMTLSLTGAPSSELQWHSINWETVEKSVFQLQMRIAKAIREGRSGKVKALQWTLTHSFHAKLLAVKRVVQNKGGNTSGVDRKLWKTPLSKIKGAQSLKRRGYKTQPLRRIYIPKSNGSLRPLSIPTMKDRAMQALYLLALLPIAEEQSNKNAYGFRPKRSAADAFQQCYGILARKGSAPWILEADIKSCFDKISHDWLLEHIPMDKVILSKWLKAGYVDQDCLYETKEGTPQGSIISPTLLNMTLHGLEEKVKTLLPQRRGKIHICLYADDFIITGATREMLEEKVKPTVVAFLKERGLELSKEKTSLVHISQGFDFLSFNFSKLKGKYLPTPSKKSVKRFLDDIRKIIKSNPTATTEGLIQLLNPKIRGWGNYMRCSCAKKTFHRIDHQIFHMVWQWARRRHPRKSNEFRKGKYFRTFGTNNWMFFAPLKTKDGKTKYLYLTEMRRISILRHTKIRAEANPFDPRFTLYFKERESGKGLRPDGNPGEKSSESEVFYRHARIAGSQNSGLKKA